MGVGVGVVWAAPPWALTLALSRPAGEGTVVVGGGTSVMVCPASPRALTLALSRPAGEGTRCCGRGYFCDGVVAGGGSSAVVGVVFGHPLRASHASPSLREGEVGLETREKPGAVLTRSFGVNDLGFEPPPNFGGGYVDRFYELVCYQQSNTDADFAKRIASGSGPE